MNEAQQKDHDKQLIWELERCRDWIQSALDVGHNTHDVEDIEDLVFQGNCQLWAGPDGCVVTNVLEYPNYRALDIWLCGGELEQIMDMLPDIERFAEYINAKRITSCGRPGWLKLLEPHGFSKGLLCVNKDIQLQSED